MSVFYHQTLEHLNECLKCLPVETLQRHRVSEDPLGSSPTLYTSRLSRFSQTLLKGEGPLGKALAGSM